MQERHLKSDCKAIAEASSISLHLKSLARLLAKQAARSHLTEPHKTPQPPVLEPGSGGPPSNIGEDHG